METARTASAGKRRKYTPALEANLPNAIDVCADDLPAAARLDESDLPAFKRQKADVASHVSSLELGQGSGMGLGMAVGMKTGSRAVIVKASARRAVVTAEESFGAGGNEACATLFHECHAQSPSFPTSHIHKVSREPVLALLPQRSLQCLSLNIKSGDNLLQLLSLRPEMLSSLTSLDLSVCKRYARLFFPHVCASP